MNRADDAKVNAMYSEILDSLHLKANNKQTRADRIHAMACALAAGDMAADDESFRSWEHVAEAARLAVDAVDAMLEAEGDEE
jgi:hypothetical protein